MKGVSDALGRLDGVADVVVDLQAGLATITPKPGARLAVPAIVEAIRRAGFRCTGVTVEATGEVKRSGGRAEFFLPGTTEPWVQLPSEAPGDGPARIRVHISAGGKVEMK